jgi:two-component system phosphate regulon response regulator PhoB
MLLPFGIVIIMKRKILIIDNDEDILLIVSFILIDKGYDTYAFKAPEILAYITALKPDLILLDHWLDGQSGGEICKKLKADRLTPHIPVIMISAVNNLSEICAECQADGFIKKPFDIDYLIQVVGENLVNGFEIPELAAAG